MDLRMDGDEESGVSAIRNTDISLPDASPDLEDEEGKRFKSPYPRRILTEDDVIAIFSAGKLRTGTSTVQTWERGQILALSRKFNVTPKTIRDIWNRRTWRDVTSRLILANANDSFPQQVTIFNYPTIICQNYFSIYSILACL